VLLEVVPEGEVEERTPVGSELHRRGEPALDHRQVARGEMAIEVVDVCHDLEAGVPGQRGGIDARPGHDDHAKRRLSPAGHPMRFDHATKEVLTHAGPADADDADLLVATVAQLLPPRPPAHAGWVEARDIPRE